MKAYKREEVARQLLAKPEAWDQLQCAGIGGIGAAIAGGHIATLGNVTMSTGGAANYMTASSVAR